MCRQRVVGDSFDGVFFFFSFFLFCFLCQAAVPMPKAMHGSNVKKSCLHFREQ